MFQAIQELIDYRQLMYMITWRELKVKYKQSVMGFMWAIFMPSVIVVSGALIRFAMATMSGKALVWLDVVGVSVKALPYAFFIASIRFATNSLTANINLVTKIYFPRQIFPICAVLSQLFDLMVASCVLAVILSIAQVGLSIYILWVPVLLVQIILLAMAFGTFLAAANLFFRDVKYLVEVVLSFAIFFTPVFYDADLAGKWAWVIRCNPVAPILEGFNSCIVLHQSPNLDWMLYSGAFALLGVYAAIVIFKGLEPKFAENI